MGALRDAAKNNSNFLIIQKGSSVIVEYVGFKLVPNMKDPTKENALMEFREMGRTKFWTTGNTNTMFFFDDLPKGTLVKITREKWIGKDGITEDPNKSSYHVEKYIEITQKPSAPQQMAAQAEPDPKDHLWQSEGDPKARQETGKPAEA